MDAVPSVRSLLTEAERILVAGHSSPDGDCIGAMLALGRMISFFGRRATLVVPDAIPNFLDFLPGVNDILVSPPELPTFDLAIIPDCSDIERLGSLSESQAALYATLPIINVDHHISNRNYGMVNVVDHTAAATCEQLFFLLPALQVPIDVSLATCLLTGIVTDTQGFRTPSTTPRTLRAATALVEIGAPLALIADQVYNRRSLATLRLWGRALCDLEEVDGIVFTRLNEDMLRAAGASWQESEALINLLSSVQNAQVAVLFKEMPDGVVRVSLRSQGRVNVAEVAAHFGGGGHVGAAGCSLVETLDTAKNLVVARVREMASS